MKQMLKNQRRKAVLVLAVSFCAVFSLLGIAGTDFEELLLILYGSEKAYVPVLQMGFLLFVILLQYFNADIVLYHIRNRSYLDTRYGSENKTFWALMRAVAFSNFAFIIFSTVGAVVGFVFRGNGISGINISNVGLLMVRGMGFFYLMSVLQIGFLHNMDEAKTFGSMALVAVALTFVNPFAILHFLESGVWKELVCWIVFYIVVDLTATVVLSEVYRKGRG